MTLHTYLLFLPACFALNMAFGPNNALSLSNGARHGVVHSLAASIGRLIAFVIMIAITGLGLGTLLMASETLFTVLKYVGAAYLMWLGVKLLRSAPPEQSSASPAKMDQKNLLFKHSKQEFYVAAGNPKAILIFTAFFPQFVDLNHYAASFIILGSTFLVLELAAIAIYAVIGARLRFLTKNSKGFIWLNRISGSLMVGFGILLASLRKPA
ncbi:LysE family translocator [Xanthomonas sp. NCPPB 3443]|uniref:LysE family translocator n=1 Tax=Xanthomonas sp. NCPPB 3443 TaxID=3243407 RepID=UPI0035575487